MKILKAGRSCQVIFNNSGFKVLRAGTFGYYDIFMGDGWYNHTRIQAIRKTGGIKFIAGQHLNPRILQQVQIDIKGMK